MKLKPIRFKEEAFKSHEEKYLRKVKLQEDLLSQFKSILPKYEVDEISLFKEPTAYLFESIEANYKKQNTLHLTGLKLAELLELNTEPFRKTAYIYQSFKNYDKPNIEDFTDYAETEEEIKRLEFCERYIELIKTYEEVYNGRVFPRDAVNSYSPQIVFFDMRKNEYAPNMHFVKPEPPRTRRF